MAVSEGTRSTSKAARARIWQLTGAAHDERQEIVPGVYRGAGTTGYKIVRANGESEILRLNPTELVAEIDAYYTATIANLNARITTLGEILTRTTALAQSEHDKYSPGQS